MHRFGKDRMPIKGRERVCMDLRPVNKALEDFDHPIPHIRKMVRALAESYYYSELDLSEAFNQLKVSPELSELFTVTTSFGKVSFTVLPYGVKFASEIFQSRMCDEFAEFLDTVLMIYIDNFIIHTKTEKEHLEALEHILTICRKANLYLRRDKCSFLKTELNTLGFVVKHGEIRPDPIKVQMLRDAPAPSNRKELRGFLGLLQFYKGILPHLAYAAHPLYAATSDKVEFKWTSELDFAYQVCKSMLEKDIMQTTLDGIEDVILYCDASKYAICAVIVQRGRIIIAVSKVLNSSQRKWPIIEKELFAISWGCKKLRVYLHGIKFTVKTDHKPLLGIMKKIDTIENMRMLAMLLSFAEFTFNTEFEKGVRNVIADFAG